MKVLFDYQAFEMQKIGGISRYFSILTERLPEYDVDTRLAILSSRNMYVRNRGLGAAFRFLHKKTGESLSL